MKDSYMKYDVIQMQTIAIIHEIWLGEENQSHNDRDYWLHVLERKGKLRYSWMTGKCIEISYSAPKSITDARPSAYAERKRNEFEKDLLYPI